KRLTAGDKIKSDAIIAPALPRWRRAVVEHVPLVTATTSAVVLRAREDEFVIGFGLNMTGDRLKEAWPPRAALKLGRGLEQRQIACCADERPRALFLVERARTWTLRYFLKKHSVSFSRKKTSPLRQGFVEFWNGRIVVFSRGVPLLTPRARRKSKPSQRQSA